MSFNKRGWRGDQFSERIGKEGTERRVKDTATLFKDAEGRTINISPAYGVQVEDSQGTIIHDTPDCVIASDMNYGGHVYWKNAANYIDSIHLSTEPDGSGGLTMLSTMANVDLTAYLPSDLTNANGLLVNVRHLYTVDDTVIKTGSQVQTNSFYSLNYNSSADIEYNYMNRLLTMAQSASADTQDISYQTGVQAMVPIAYDGDTPYLSWMGQFVIGAATTATGATVDAYFYVYLQGFLV